MSATDPAPERPTVAIFGVEGRVGLSIARALGREGTGPEPAERVRRFMVDGDEIDGVRVRVAELTAGAGDVVAMLPWTLHNFSMNCAAVPRFMVTHTAHRRGVEPPAED